MASSVGLWKRRQVVKMWWLLNNGPSKFDILRLALEIQVDAQWVEPISWEWFYLTRMLHQNGFHPIFWCFFLLFFCKLTLRPFSYSLLRSIEVSTEKPLYLRPKILKFRSYIVQPFGNFYMPHVQSTWTNH